MISDKATRQTLRKLNRFADMLHDRLFAPVAEIPVTFYQTLEQHFAPPEDALFAPVPASARWGGEGYYGWFQGGFTVPDALAGIPLYLYPEIGGYEATLWVDGQIRDNYATKEIIGSHGNHYAKPLCLAPVAGQTLRVALEYYAYHDMPGTQPFDNVAQEDYTYAIGPVRVCTQDTQFLSYWGDLKTLLVLVDALGEESFRRADVLYTLLEVHQELYYDASSVSDEIFRKALADTQPRLSAQLAKRNGDSAPYVGLIGHSHMDTAWLWPMRETIKKNARTFAAQLSLMERYPEYRFIQSSTYHTEMIRRHQPALFERVKDAVAEGRYEPNGGVFVECDCNLTGGEPMIRQFLWGQRYTQQHFAYRSDAFWLPDTFGYSAAIPQIMKGCGIDYFLTTKIAWNDTTKFPYTSFYWQGLDGTRVLTHFNRTHLGPDPQTLRELTEGGSMLNDPIMEKPVSDMRLFSYGPGDGGGGPTFEMVEMSRRLHDLEGTARSAHETVSSFMRRLAQTIRKPSIWAGELYLELHRGTLTNQHEIKRNNRLAEIAMHDLELLTVADAVARGVPADGTPFVPLMEALLVNQFHDILPGTCIHSVHAQSLRETGEVIDSANAASQALLAGDGQTGCVTVYNTTGFVRNETIYLPWREGYRLAGGYAQQRTQTMDGEAQLAVDGVVLPPLGSAVLQYEPGEIEAESAFVMADDRIETPHASVVLDARGGFASFVDKHANRQLRAAQGYPLGTFLFAEDVSAGWDNWDVDADLMDKFQPLARLLGQRVVSAGPVELRLRQEYRVGEGSTIVQDVVFSASSPQVTFDTRIDWQEEHRFLKAAFDTTVYAETARHEIQFGNIQRSTHQNTDADKARFEVCNHKFTDMSEPGYGVAILNDCKYGISVRGSSMHLSLHKGGMLPDRAGDKGTHRCRYALLPHASAFGAESVILPAYALNYLPCVAPGSVARGALVKADRANVVIETIKPCEDADRAYIVRLYEGTGTETETTLEFSHAVASLARTNMLEEVQQAYDTAQTLQLTVKPFEIVTLRVGYGA